MSGDRDGLREAARGLATAQEVLDHCEDHDPDYIDVAYEARAKAIERVIAEYERLPRAEATEGLDVGRLHQAMRSVGAVHGSSFRIYGSRRSAERVAAAYASQPEPGQ